MLYLAEPRVRDPQERVDSDRSTTGQRLVQTNPGNLQAQSGPHLAARDFRSRPATSRSSRILESDDGRGDNDRLVKAAFARKQPADVFESTPCKNSCQFLT